MGDPINHFRNPFTYHDINGKEKVISKKQQNKIIAATAIIGVLTLGILAAPTLYISSSIYRNKMKKREKLAETQTQLKNQSNTIPNLPNNNLKSTKSISEQARSSVENDREITKSENKNQTTDVDSQKKTEEKPYVPSKDKFTMQSPYFRQKGSYINNAHVRDLTSKLETSCPKLHQILTNECWKDNHNQLLTVTQKGPQLAIPTGKSLLSIADKYKAKYDIDIKVITPDAGGIIDCIGLQAALREELKDRTLGYIGIVYDREGTTDHVVPMILKIDGDTTQALIVDVRGAEGGHEATKITKSALNSLGIPYVMCSDIRQSDIYSCRIGSVVTLRNALLSLKDKEPSSFEPFKIFEQNVVKGSTFKLPPAWGGANDQIFRPMGSIDKVLNPRQKHSRQEGKQVEKISETRNRHRVDLNFELEFVLPGHDLTRNLNIKELGLPEDIKVSQAQNGQLFIEWTSKKQVNGYMLKKGRKVAGLDTVIE